MSKVVTDSKEYITMLEERIFAIEKDVAHKADIEELQKSIASLYQDKVVVTDALRSYLRNNIIERTALLILMIIFMFLYFYRV